jgi:predicted signal transduction protein with EAL and GGDEF domain
VATRIVKAIRSEPFTSGDQSRQVTVSAGIASYPNHGRTSSEVMRSADTALYSAKRAGRDRWTLADGDAADGVADHTDGVLSSSHPSSRSTGELA